MNETARPRELRAALLALRITLGIFLLQWGIEKFLVPESTVGIWQHFYGVEVSSLVSYVLGVAELLLAACLFLGVFRTVAYGASLLLHTVTVLVSWRQLLDPWGDPVNHLFIASAPVLGAFLALFLLRHLDSGVFDRTSPRSQ
jgi:putative oxidoreductase